MPNSINLSELRKKAKCLNRYENQLQRLQHADIPTDCIEQAVDGAISSLSEDATTTLVIYGEPQSGKTEMMICLTAKLLDIGHKMIVHLMNDSVDLLAQNLKRFKRSGLAPAPRISSELPQLLSGKRQNPQEFVAFCKKNARDLEKLIEGIKDLGKVVVVDDEADYATPNAKVNQGEKTSINRLVERLIGNGFYIGVTATPARLDLNHTFNNDTEKWVRFPAHEKYTGQDVFFPISEKISYHLTLLKQTGTPKDAQDALIRFLVTVAYLNVHENAVAENYTMLVHTSGRKQDHETDREIIEDAVRSLTDTASEEFDSLARMVYETALERYPEADAEELTGYVVSNASRTTLVVLNSERDRTAAGDSATEPTSPFTIIVGGNIVSRGVTFQNLLSMFFTRNVRHKLQQDTYIQRARMFGARGSYLKHFELTIPKQLYADWHRCFVFHRLALDTIKDIGSPVWIGDKRIAVTANPSIEKATVDMDRGEMSYELFDFSDDLDAIIQKNQKNVVTLREIREKIGNNALPKFLIDYIEMTSANDPTSLAIHTSSSIASYGDDVDKKSISRRRGFIGLSQMEAKKFPGATHHVKILYNGDRKAKVFYKCKDSLQFIQSMRTEQDS